MVEDPTYHHEMERGSLIFSTSLIPNARQKRNLCNLALKSVKNDRSQAHQFWLTYCLGNDLARVCAGTENVLNRRSACVCPVKRMITRPNEQRSAQHLRDAALLVISPTGLRCTNSSPATRSSSHERFFSMKINALNTRTYT